MKSSRRSGLNVLVRKPGFWIGVITLVAFFLRVWRLNALPPGWRDDELINSLVISQKFLNGDWQVYYADASGHEALYHILNAGMLALFGPGAAGIGDQGNPVVGVEFGHQHLERLFHQRQFAGFVH